MNSYSDTQILYGAMGIVVTIVWGLFSLKIHKESEIRQDDRSEETIPSYMRMHERLESLQRQVIYLWWGITLLLAVMVVMGAPKLMPLPADQAKIVMVPEEDKPVQKLVPVKTAQPEKTVAHAPATNAPPASALPYSDITEFDETDSKQQAALDYLKQRYENWFIAYYYLEKCKVAPKSDFDLIQGSMKRELEAAHTNVGATEENIMIAANGSYNELYSTSPCDEERLKATKASYETFIAPLRGPNAKVIK